MDHKLYEVIWNENYVRLTVRIPKELMPRVKILKERLALNSINATIVFALERMLKRHKL